MKAQLEALVLEMHRGGILYSEAVREFRRAFITTVIRENNGNQLRSSRGNALAPAAQADMPNVRENCPHTAAPASVTALHSLRQKPNRPAIPRTCGVTARSLRAIPGLHADVDSSPSRELPHTTLVSFYDFGSDNNRNELRK